MHATATAAPTNLEQAPVAAPDAPRERLAWGFTLGCAVVAAGVVALARFLAPAPPPPDELGAVSSSGWDPLSDARPFGEDDGTPLPFVSPPLVTPELFAPAPPAVPARVTPGPIVVSGRLPREVVARILRQSQGRLRGCYEVGLRANPNLAGHVSARLVIGRDGGVALAANGGSDLPDGAVVSCVMRALHGLSFPRPEGGIVTLLYPIAFAPG